MKLVIVALKSAPREYLTHHGAPLTYVAVSPSPSLSLLPRDSPSPGARVRMLAPPAKGSSGTPHFAALNREIVDLLVGGSEQRKDLLVDGLEPEYLQRGTGW